MYTLDNDTSNCFACIYKIELQLIALGSTLKKFNARDICKCIYMFAIRACNCVNYLCLILKKRTIRKIICINVLF